MVTEAALRIVFFGTPPFAVPTLDALLASRHAVASVVTQPDRPRGRGHHVAQSPVKARASAAGLPILQPLRLKDPAFIDALRALQADLGVVAAYGKILTDEVLAIPRLGMINVHASLLPRYRGAAPVPRAIIAGEDETGITIMRVVKALDAGPMLRSAPRPIGIDETSEQVESELARLGAELLMRSVDDIAAGRAQETAQDEAAATYAHRLTKEDGNIDWRRTARQIHDQVRGLHPWPHAQSFLKGRRLILLRSSLTADAPHTADPGTIVEASGDRLIVAAGDAPLRLVQVQAEGKRPMLVREFMAGHHLSAGDRFTALSGAWAPDTS
jgi:methionyl-tRNA formyltransferase